MKQYNFDKIIDRSGTNTVKYELLPEYFGNKDLLPLWVADMDFETPDFIMEALRKRLKHPVLGYTVDPPDYWPSVIDWLYDHHGWKVERDWLKYIPGIVKGIGMVINALLRPDEKVVIQPPVYHPFRLVPEGNKREVVFNPLKELPNGQYAMDFENLEQVVDDKCKLLILSNPHNPAGHIWDKKTLEQLADFCWGHHILVISDEIHCDLVLWGKRHTPFATISEKAAQSSITFGAPTKTFNIAGVVSSYAIVPNPDIRKKFYSWMDANEFGDAPLFSPIATIATFRHGEPWRQQLLKYLEANILFVEDYCRHYLPKIKPLRPEASYLVWLDCRELGLSQPELNELFVKKAKLALNDGEMFGHEGIGFMRLNVGSPRAILKQALDQLRDAMSAD